MTGLGGQVPGTGGHQSRYLRYANAPPGFLKGFCQDLELRGRKSELNLDKALPELTKHLEGAYSPSKDVAAMINRSDIYIGCMKSMANKGLTDFAVVQQTCSCLFLDTSFDVATSDERLATRARENLPRCYAKATKQ